VTLHFIALKAGKDKYSCVVNEHPVQLEFNDSASAYNSVTASRSHRHYFTARFKRNHRKFATQSVSFRMHLTWLSPAQFIRQIHRLAIHATFWR